jgi:propanol-preferring alcohol dehydrogenase
VLGVGGLGHMAVQILKATTACRIVAVDTDPVKLALATDLGADLVVPAGPEAAAAILDATDGFGAAAVFDFVGADDTLALAVAAVAGPSKIVIVGGGGGTVPLTFSALPFNCSVQTTLWGTMAEFREVLALAAAGRITVRTELIPLTGAIDAYSRLQSGSLGSARAVAVP